MIKYNIVLIADRIQNKAALDMQSDKLEQIGDDYFFQIYNSLQRISPKVTHYNDLPTFIDNIYKHRNDIVFTMYGGNSSRNRMALVPGICESYNIKYVGADVYNRIICQDKNISKELAKKAGILVPDSVTINSLDNLNTFNLHLLKYPVVIKPLMEGSSIGITKNSLCQNANNIKEKIEKLYKTYNQPIMVEQFIPGKEIVTCLVGSSKNIRLAEMVEVCVEQDNTYFNDKLYTGEIKHQNKVNTYHRIITSEIDGSIMNTIKQVFTSFGKMDYMRIDGKLYNNKFYMIEFTPDASLSAHCSFKDIYEYQNKTYDNLMEDIINSSLENYRIQ